MDRDLKEHERFASTLDAVVHHLRTPGEADLSWRLEQVAALLSLAHEEYRRAVADDRIKEPLEYDGSRGLFLLARQAFDRLAPTLRPQDSETVATIAAEFDRLAPVWPAVERPIMPVMSPAEVSAAIARIERSAERLVRQSV
ncbi:hypothetical protein [Benzoatithermus flavus]|uniref:Uncharacterized protein n=1 Tax=Benzoatithermus flavus TaxID=3108223 RepID=A0ABU8XWI7_9PROT